MNSILLKFFGFLILILYFLVLAVALTEGPLISYPSFFLGITGLVIILMLVASLAKRINLVDVSDEERKDHIGAIPLVGGIGLFVSLVYGAFVYGVDTFYIYLPADIWFPIRSY